MWEDIETSDLELITDIHIDAGGYAYKFNCPKCKTEIILAPHGWWPTACECGFNWGIQVKAIGSRYVEK
jgi:hypothetical protein